MDELAAGGEERFEDTKLLHHAESVRVHDKAGALVLDDAGPALEEDKVNAREVEGMGGRQPDGPAAHDDDFEVAGLRLTDHGCGGCWMFRVLDVVTAF